MIIPLSDGYNLVKKTVDFVKAEEEALRTAHCAESGVRGGGGLLRGNILGVRRGGQVPDREPGADGDPAPAEQEEEIEGGARKSCRSALNFNIKIVKIELKIKVN